MSYRLFYVLLGGLAIGLLALALSRDHDGVSGLELTSGDLASLVAKIAIVMVFGTTVLTIFRYRFSQALQAILIWLAIAIVLATAYTYRTELRGIADRVLADLIPGRPVQFGRTVEIARGHGGEFQVFTQINGARVAMVLDSGASSVVLTQEAAKAAGLPLEVLSYTVDIETANGRTRAAAVMLDRVAVGGIVERSVPALIAQAGRLKMSLLGMSFLNRLESWEVRGDRLLIRGSP